MEMFNNVILNIILILFPLLIYFVFICYQEINNDKSNIPIFEMTMITSLYLCLKYGNLNSINELLLFCFLYLFLL